MSESGRETTARPTGTDPLTLADLADLLGAPVQGDPATPVTGVTLASAEIGPGMPIASRTRATRAIDAGSTMIG